MTIEVTDDDESVILTYHADSGGSASATIVGLSATEVRNRAEEFVSIHELAPKAEDDA